jgi:hypothetical protein
MFKRSSSLVPLALISLMEASSLALAACSSDDEDSNREASGGSGFVVDGNTGNAKDNKTYRGVSLEVNNDFGQDIWVSFAGRCNKQFSGTDGWVKLAWKERARWRACDDLIYGPRDYGTQVFSALSWGGDSPGAGNVERFTLKNPAIGKPQFFFAERDCFHNNPNEDIIGSFSENQFRSAENKSKNCGARVLVEREGDGRNYKDFNLWVEPQGG